MFDIKSMKNMKIFSPLRFSQYYRYRRSAVTILSCIIYCLPLLWGLSTPSIAGGERVYISRFGEEQLNGWQEKLFEGETQYSLVEDSSKSKVLKAESHGAASGLWKEKQIDLRATPYLNWSWKVTTFPGVADEQTKEGDDYPARIYVIFKVGSWFWDTRALNYVWSSNYPAGEKWPNAFTSKAWMYAVRSGAEQAGMWLSEKRNVRDDIRQCFGLTVDTIEAVAIMSDSDNSKTQATAFYADIYFSGE